MVITGAMEAESTLETPHAERSLRKCTPNCIRRSHRATLFQTVVGATSSFLDGVMIIMIFIPMIRGKLMW